jgi:LemA protein
MKTKNIVAGIVIAFIVMIFMIFVTTNNRAISLEEQILSAESDVQVQEKRRNDLIYNLADCVKNYDSYEAKTLLQVVEARNLGKEAKIEGNISTYIAAIAEQYPDLKANENYKELMNELSMTENKISEVRITYNNQIRNYNKYVRRFPHKQILGIMGYSVVDYTYLTYSKEERTAVRNLFGDKENGNN